MSPHTANAPGLAGNRLRMRVSHLRRHLRKSVAGSRRLPATVSAVLAVALGTALLAPAAQATGVLPDSSTDTGSITITKLYTPAGTTRDTGAENTTIDTDVNKPVAGVMFNVTRVTSYNGSGTIDLTTQAGWNIAAAAAASFDPSLATMSTPFYPNGGTVNVATDDDGVVEFTGLPLGLYYIEEASVPAGVAPAEPILVTLPMSNPAGTGWMYSIYLYPKNDLVTASKAADNSQATVVGTQINYTILGSLPMDVDSTDGPNTISEVSAYAVTDDLDARLSVAKADVTVTLAGDGTGSGAPQPLDPPTDPTTGISDDYTITVTNTNDVSVVFSAQGLGKLTQAAQLNFNNHGTTGYNAGYDPIQVSVVIAATVNSNLNTQNAMPANLNPNANVIINTATVYPDAISLQDSQTSSQTNPGVVTPEVFSYFGGVNLHKVDATTGETLNGATFQVYATEADALAQTGALNAQASNTTPQATFTTGTDGTGDGSVAILGLSYEPEAPTGVVLTPVSDAATLFAAVPANGVSYSLANAETADGTRCQVTMGSNSLWGTPYWVVETAAPTQPQGYELLPDPVEVCVTGALDSDPGTLDDIVIPNIVHNAGFQMPFTGWLADHLLVVLGVSVLAGSALLKAINTRRKEVQL